METIDASKDSVTIIVSRDELAFLCSAIIEALKAVEEGEFQTRTGETTERATELLHQISGAA